MTSPKKYNVFLCYRSDDTGDNFTSHLYYGLCQKEINTFIDYNLEKGHKILSGLLKAIEESEISIIIFSKNFVYSKWCLDELIKIVECMKTNGQIVIHIFYHADPQDVRNQTGSFNDVFVNLDKYYFKHVEELQKYKDALMEVSNICGWDSSKTRPESKLVEEIVAYIKKKLEDISPIQQIQSSLYTIHLPNLKRISLIKRHTIIQKFCYFEGFNLDSKNEDGLSKDTLNTDKEFSWRT